MTVTAIRKDPSSRTMTPDVEFDVSPERVGQLWADPRDPGEGICLMTTPETTEIMQRFDKAFVEHDPDLLPDLIAPVCVMESERP